MSDFEAVRDFHRKFDLPVSNSVAHEISNELRDFRLKFLLEELQELAEGYGLELQWTLAPIRNASDAAQDLPKIADALVDLVYVALGTAHYHNLPWDKLFNEVQRANLSKERCLRAEDSSRGSTFDVVKPQGWKPPAIIEVLMREGWRGPALPLEEK